jgi:hypothetical protein
LSQLDAGVADLDVFGEDEIREALPNTLGRRCRKIHQDAIPQLGHAHVGQHASLRGQKSGIAALARRQRGDVIGQQALEIVSPVGSGQLQAAPGMTVEQSRTVEQRVVLVV